VTAIAEITADLYLAGVGVGITTCALLRVQGREIAVRGLDAIDGTPVVDIKPYLSEFGPRGDVRQPEWASELMKRYWQ
jgi:tRNA (Thr-GGU) A37 N-methylase